MFIIVFFSFFLFGNGKDKIAGILTGLSSQDKTRKCINNTKQLHISSLEHINVEIRNILQLISGWEEGEGGVGLIRRASPVKRIRSTNSRE